MAPVVPLLVISFCLILEVFSTGSGISAMLKAWGLKKIFLMKSRYADKDCSTEQEKCPSDFFKLVVRVGEKQRICRCPSDFNWNKFRLHLFRTWKLQAITMLYIGGASGTSSLLTCQDLDGNQDASAMFWCNFIFFLRFWALFALRVLSFLFLVRVLCSRCFCFSLSCFLCACFAEKYMKIDLLRSAKQPALVRCIFRNCLPLWSFGYICSHFCRFESPFWMPRCYPKFKTVSHLRNPFRPTTPSDQPHLLSCVRSTRRWSFGWISLAMFARLATPSWFLLLYSTSFTGSA